MQTEIIQSMEGLPRLAGGEPLYLDVETTGLHPYGGDRVVGYALTNQDADRAWYIPVRHSPDGGSLFDTAKNLDPVQVAKWIGVRVNYCSEWINHNVKFDAHAIGEELRLAGIHTPIVERADLVDTLPLAKLVDCYSKLGGYDLKKLAAEWCGRDTGTEKTLKEYLKNLKRSKQVGEPNYGDVPIGILGPYAGDDVLHNRALWKEIQRRRYEGDRRVWEIERNVTAPIFRMERRGVLVDSELMGSMKRDLEGDLVELEGEIEESFGGVDLGKKSLVQEILFDRYELPVLSVTDHGAPSVDAMAIQTYLDDTTEGTEPHQFVTLLSRYRELTQFLGLYSGGWPPHIGQDGRLHTDYNQSVRTGRMSSRKPNLQQLNSRAKSLIVPGEGRSFISRDYSQVEYRIIAYYMADPEVIRRYQSDPDTDYHQLVADMVGIGRKPAKNVNFGIAFGMGEGGLLKQLAKNSAGGATEAKSILTRYHRRFPRLRPALKRAERTALGRGYVRTIYGRRRALPRDFARKAFNSAVQGSAADIAKEALIRVDASETLKRMDAHPVLITHDDVLLDGATGTEGQAGAALTAEMVRMSVRIPIPLYVSGGASSESWALAG